MDSLCKPNFMFLGRTVSEKDAMITCKIQSCRIALINNFEILQVSIAFFSDTVRQRNLKFFFYINPYVTCHAKTSPSAHFIILRKTITNTEHEHSIEFEFFIYDESTMTHLRGDTFEIFIWASFPKFSSSKADKVSFSDAR